MRKRGHPVYQVSSNLGSRSPQVQVIFLCSVSLMGSSTVEITENARQRHGYKDDIVLDLAVAE
jgi:hypothetical protein